MFLFQILAVIFILFALSRTILQFREGKLRLGWFVVWNIFWIAVGIVVLRPETTSFLARLVGISRGADLAVYLSIIALFYLAFRILVKIESLEQQITRVVRHVALEEREKKE